MLSDLFSTIMGVSENIVHSGVPISCDEPTSDSTPNVSRSVKWPTRNRLLTGISIGTTNQSFPKISANSASSSRARSVGPASSPPRAYSWRVEFQEGGAKPSGWSAHPSAASPPYPGGRQHRRRYCRRRASPGLTSAYRQRIGR